jgi:hypothetical protein
MLIFSVCLFYTNTNIADQLHQRSSAAPKIILMRTFLLTALIGLLPVFACTPVSQDSSNETTAEIPPFDLDTLQKMNFNYFWDLADTATYQVLDPISEADLFEHCRYRLWPDELHRRCTQRLCQPGSCCGKSLENTASIESPPTGRC